MKIAYRHIAYAEAEAENGPVKKIYDSDKSYMNNQVYRQNITPDEWATHELNRFESDKQKGIILEYAVIDPNSMPPLLQLVNKVSFTELVEDVRIGPAVDRYFERHGWDLRIVRVYNKTQDEGYQVYFGKGVQVDNNFEYGFPHLYEKADVIAFAKSFFLDKVCTEDMEQCPICGAPISPDDGEDDGYGDLSLYWNCENCGHTGSAIINTHNDNEFVRHKVD